MKNYDKLNLNPHKEARFAMWLYGELYAKTGLGSMQFYETCLNDNDRKLCEKAVQDILNSRDKKAGEK